MVRWILDIDGTLAMPSAKRLSLLPDGRHNCLAHLDIRDIDRFMDPVLMTEDVPSPWCRAILARSSGSPRCFLTARMEKLRPVTVEWLAAVGWSQAQGYMRPNEATTATSIAVKLDALRQVIDQRDTILVDDDIKLLSAVRAEFSNIRGIYAPNWFEYRF